MGFFSKLFKSAPEPLTDLSAIGCDIHSHFIPAIDDGSKSVEESVEMISNLQKLGIEKFYTTPHIMADYYQNSPETILPGLEKVREGLKTANINVELNAAAEYYLDDGFLSKLESGQILPIAGKYILCEFSYINRPTNHKDLFFAMKINGFRPILAHPERYSYFFEDFKVYTDLHEFEVSFQVNLGSLTGMYSAGSQKIARELIENDLVQFVGTDMHNMKNFPFYEKLLSDETLINFVNSGKIQNHKLFL